MAIIIAGALIAGAVLYGNKNKNYNQPASANSAALGVDNKNQAAEGPRPVTANDHIRGNPDAPVKIIEFSDPECPFCKRFHYTMQQVIGDYGKSGKVAWVYRHFPLDSLHPKARKEAEALECANEAGGNAKFWSYLDRLMEVTPSNNGLNPNELPAIAQYVGLDKPKFQTCLDSGKYASRVAANLEEAINSGGNGTPYSFVVGASGKKAVIPGALPYEQVKTLIDQALSARQ